MIKLPFSTPEEQKVLIANYDSQGFILAEVENLLSGNFLTFITSDEKNTYGKTEIEILNKENADLWYESMSQSARIETMEVEAASLWYEFMKIGGI